MKRRGGECQYQAFHVRCTSAKELLRHPDYCPDAISIPRRASDRSVETGTSQMAMVSIHAEAIPCDES